MDYAVSWRVASQYGGSRSDLERLIEASDDVIPFTDPVTSAELWTLREGTTVYDADDDALLVTRRPTHLDGEPDYMSLAQIFRPRQYVVVSAGNQPAQILNGTGATVSEIVEARRKGELTAGDMVASADFLSLVRRAATLLPDVSDLQLIEESGDVATIGSESIGITCTIVRGTGECIAATFAKPGQAPSRWQVLDRFPEPVFPARYPSLLRRTWHFRGDQVEIRIIDDFRARAVSHEEVAWSSYRDTAWDRANNTIIAADGTVLTEDAAAPGANMLHPLPEWAKQGSARQRKGRVETPGASVAAGNDRTVVAPPAPPMPSSPLRLALFAGGGGLIAVGLGLYIRRRLQG